MPAFSITRKSGNSLNALPVAITVDGAAYSVVGKEVAYRLYDTDNETILLEFTEGAGLEITDAAGGEFTLTADSSAMDLDAATYYGVTVITDPADSTFELELPDDETGDTWTILSSLSAATSGSTPASPVDGSLYPISSYADLSAVDDSALRANAVRYVSGRTTAGDGGAGHWMLDTTSTATVDGCTILATASGTGRWLRQYSGPIDVRWAGAAVDGTTDDTSAAQAAIDAAYALGGGTVFFPVGTCLSGPLTLKYKVSLAGASLQAFNEIASSAPASVLKLKASSTAPLITSDQVNGYVRSATSALGPGAQLYQLSSISNLMLDGNKANQTTLDADIIRLYQVWNVIISDCSLLNSKGFGLRVLDCNVINLRNVSAVSAPIYAESLADSVWSNVQAGGGNGTIYPAVWLDGSRGSCWQNSFSGCMFFNNAGNAAATTATFTADASTDVCSSVGHGYVDATPLIVSTTGTLPGNLSAVSTFYVKRLTADTFKLATTRANLAAGIYVDISSAGSGTHTASIGGNAGLYVNGALALWNGFTATRFDQNYGHGIWLNGAQEHTFSGCMINSSGLGNVTGQYGAYLTNAARRHSFAGCQINGSLVNSGGMNSNQVVGIYADSTSTGTVYQNAGNTIISHGTADIVDGAFSGYAESIYLPPAAFYAAQGSPTVGTIASGRYPAWMLDASTTESVCATFPVPNGWATARITVLWANASSGSGNVVFSVGTAVVASGGTIGAETSSPGATATAGAQDVLVQTVCTGSTVTLTQGSILIMRVKRDGSNGSDTLANDCALLGVRLEKVS